MIGHQGGRLLVYEKHLLSAAHLVKHILLVVPRTNPSRIDRTILDFLELILCQSNQLYINEL